MDKQMIEEMAKEIVRILFEDCLLNIGGSCADCEWNGKETKEYDCQSLLVSKKLLEKYQPKIPENAVVLTGTETEERLDDLVIEFDEMSFYPATLMPNAEECASEWKRKLIYAIGQLRKETAEKFARKCKQRLSDKLHRGKALHTTVFGKEYVRRIFKEAIDEIYKEIIGEKV